MPKPPKQKAFSVKAVLLLLGVCGAGGLGITIGLQSMRHELAARLYRQKLEQLAEDYGDLLDQYNRAVRQQAVTRLVVQDNTLTLTRRDAHGRIESIPVDVDLSKQIYVDFIIQHDRLWIRSIFDGSTTPEAAQVIDPDVWGIDWDAQSTQHGLIAYRKLTEGHWVVTASENGGLRLRKVDNTEEIDLQPAPPIRLFEELENQIIEQIN